jgi:hypothetical protein
METETKQKQRSLVGQIFRGLLFFLAGAFSLLLIFIIIIPCALSVFWGKDIPPVNDSALNWQTINLPQDKNAFYDLEKITGQDDEKNVPDGKNLVSNYLESDQWADEKVEALLDDNKQFLENFSLAAAKGAFQSPYSDSPEDLSSNTLTIIMGGWRSASRLSGVKAIHLAKDGRYGEALDEAAKAIAVGTAIERSQCGTITYLTAIAIKKTGLDTWQKVVSMIPAGSLDLSEYRLKLEDYKTGGNTTPFIGEYIAYKNFLNGDFTSADFGNKALLEKIAKNKFYFKKNLTTSYGFNVFNGLAAESKKECSDEKKVEVPDRFIETDNMAKLYFTENALGKMMATMSVLALNNVITKRCEVEEKLEETISLTK